MLNGMTLAGLNPANFSLADVAISLGQLKQLGADWVALVVIGYQQDINSTEIKFDGPKTLGDEQLGQVVEQARWLGLKILLKPHVDCEKPVDEEISRIEIGRDFNEGQRQAWFDSYQKMLLHYAKFASEHGIEQFCIGTELTRLQNQSVPWRHLVEQTRAAFDGKLLYAANAGSLKDDQSKIDWWDAVDFVGVDAYYSLRAAGEPPSLQTLIAQWRTETEHLADLERPVVFTEVGFVSNAGCSINPWDSPCGNIDLEEQRLAYEATFKAFEASPWFHGSYWYTCYVDPQASGPDDNDFSPVGKPAGNVLRHFFNGGDGKEENTRLAVFDGQYQSTWNDNSWDSDVSITLDPFSPDAAMASSVIKITIHKVYGAWSFHAGETIDLTTLNLLEFEIAGFECGCQKFWVYGATGETETIARRRQLDDRRYLAGAKVEPGVWKKVSVPLHDLNVQKISHIVLANRCGEPAPTFLIKNVRFKAW